jgi:hypothetical protein
LALDGGVFFGHGGFPRVFHRSWWVR